MIPKQIYLEALLKDGSENDTMIDATHPMPGSTGGQFTPPGPPSPADIVSEAGVRVVAGGEVLGVLPPVLVRAPGGLVVHHPVSTPAPASSWQTDALLGAAVQTRLVRPHVPAVGVKLWLIFENLSNSTYLLVSRSWKILSMDSISGSHKCRNIFDLTLDEFLRPS